MFASQKLYTAYDWLQTYAIFQKKLLSPLSSTDFQENSAFAISQKKIGKKKELNLRLYVV